MKHRIDAFITVLDQPVQKLVLIDIISHRRITDIQKLTPIGEIVDNDNIIATPRIKRMNKVAANEAGATRYDYQNSTPLKKQLIQRPI